MQDGQKPGQSPQEPGWVFKPGDGSQQPAELPPLSNADIPQAVAPEVTPQAASPTPVIEPQHAHHSQPVASVQERSSEPSTHSEGPGHIEWTASEYIANPKNAGWYFLLAIGSIVLVAVIYFITREIMPTIVVGLLGVIVGVFAARQPQTLQYVIDTNGLYIGNKHYPYTSFKAFSVASDQAIGFIQLLPLKRFMPPLVIHYAPEDEDGIANTLADYLPYEEHKADMVDNLTRRLRF